MNKKYLLIGNPNVGKTTVFNSLTGLNERVSNFEGVTVSKKEGEIKATGDLLIDLPGTNNLNDNALISKIISQTIIEDNYSGILYVVDVNNLKKNLYMLVDILETHKEVDVLLNMNDLFKGNIDIPKLEDTLKVKAHTIDKNNCLNFKGITFESNSFVLKYDSIIEELIEKLIEFRNKKETSVNKRYLIVQMIKGSSEVEPYFNQIEIVKDLIKDTEKEVVDSGKAYSLSGLIFKNKREFILNLLDDVYYKTQEVNQNKFSVAFDKIALHKIGGYVLFAFIMWLIFLISFQFAFLGDIVDAGWSIISSWVDILLINVNTPEIIHSFIIKGFMAGVGSIIVFLPQILILFSLLTLLEGSGYLSRVSVLFEDLFNKLGLSSHSLIPMISGLGCNVLAIMSTRTIKDEQKRISTILGAPFISCSARLPVYLIFIQIFFVNNKALVLLSLYLLGIMVAIGLAYVIDKVIYKEGKSEITLTTLPTYKMISVKYFVKAISNKVRNFLAKAGKLILIGTMVIWVLIHFGFSGYTTDVTQTFLFNISSIIAILLQPLGFGTPEAAASLVAAFFAKELAISSMVVAYGSSSIEALQGVLQTQFTVASAYSFMVFTLLYIPCISTLGSIYSETKKRSLVLYSIVISLVLGYGFSFLAYNIISLFA